MGTIIRNNISHKNEYWIPKHRYLELKHFALQYPDWKKSYLEFDGLSRQTLYLDSNVQTSYISNPTERCFEERLYFRDRMDMIEEAALRTDNYLADYIVKAVSEGLSYTTLKTNFDIPYGRDLYYKLYRRFFWILNHTRK